MNRGRSDLLDSSNGVQTPYLVLDLDRVGANVEQIRASFSGLQPQVCYAVKANGDRRLLAVVRDWGWGFEVASINEIRWLHELGVSPCRMTFSSMVKIPGHIKEAYSLGVDCFALDSVTEVAKLASNAPGSRIVVRIEVPHAGSRWPLAGKFGVPLSEAVSLLRLAQASGLRPYGVTYHVGSQCLRPQSWLEAISLCGQVRAVARKHYATVYGADTVVAIPGPRLGGLVFDLKGRYTPVLLLYRIAFVIGRTGFVARARMASQKTATMKARGIHAEALVS